MWLVCVCIARLLCQPLLGRHACKGSERTEEGGLAGEARVGDDSRQLHVWTLKNELLGMTNAVFVQELAVSGVSLAADAVDDGWHADTQLGVLFVYFPNSGRIYMTIRPLFAMCNGTCVTFSKLRPR